MLEGSLQKSRHSYVLSEEVLLRHAAFSQCFH